MTQVTGRNMQAGKQGFKYTVDIVLVIDCTAGMRPFLKQVQESALRLSYDLLKEMEIGSRRVDSLRVRVIGFRDFYADSAADSLVESEFFTLPEQAEKFAAFVNGLEARGGGDDPETALEALAEAIRSPWEGRGVRGRQLIVVWTDTSAHPLEKNAGSKPPGYPKDMPSDLNELTDMWEGQTYMRKVWKRLVVYAPDAYPWNDIVNTWTWTVGFISAAGEGLTDDEYQQIMRTIAEA